MTSLWPGSDGVYGDGADSDVVTLVTVVADGGSWPVFIQKVIGSKCPMRRMSHCKQNASR